MASMLEEKDAIRDLMSAYCFHVDDGEFDKFAALFTSDATAFGTSATRRSSAPDSATTPTVVCGSVMARTSTFLTYLFLEFLATLITPLARTP